MDNSNDNMQFNSSNIARNPQEGLIQNVVRNKKPNAFQKFIRKHLALSIAALVVAVIAVGVSGWFIVVGISNLFQGEEPPIVTTPDYNAIVSELWDSVKGISAYSSYDEVQAADKKVNDAIAAAEETGNRNYIFRVKLVKADLLVNTGRRLEAMENIITPLTDSSTTPEEQYQLLSRSIDIYEYLVVAQDEPSFLIDVRSYLMRIVLLPEDVFPEDRPRSSFEERLAQLQYL